MSIATPVINAVNNRNYIYGPSSEVIYVSSGGSKDWVYGDGGVIPSYSIECFGSSFVPPVSWIPGMGREIYAGMKNVAQQLSNK